MKSSAGRPTPFKEPSREVDPVFYALRKRRIDLGITQTELAHRIGYHEDTLRSLETGLRNPKWRMVQDLAQALGMKLKIEQIHE